MDKLQIPQELHPLPYKIHSGLSIGMHILFAFVSIMFLGATFLPWNELEGIFVRISSAILGAFIAVSWFYVGVLKKSFIEMTSEEISIQTLFGLKKLKWADIIDVQTYHANNNSFIGLVSKQKVSRRKSNFLTLLADLFGGQYALSLPLKNFPKCDPEKLYATIFYRIREVWNQKSSEDKTREIEALNSDASEHIEYVNNPWIALIKAFGVSLIVGIIYGLTAFLFKMNIILVPMLGMLGILYVYSKNYQETSVNIIARFLLGIVCLSQTFIALIEALILLNIKLINIHGFWMTFTLSAESIINSWDKYISYYLVGIICFFMGGFEGISLKFTRKISKIFMKKQNGYYIKKEKRYISIYLVDYAEYDEKAEKSIISINPNVCLVARNKKRIGAIYLPEEIFNEFSIQSSGFVRTYQNCSIFYRLDLGEYSDPSPYGYTCYLTLNQSNQIEVIQLELD